MRTPLILILTCLIVSGLKAQTLPITYKKQFLRTQFRYDNLLIAGVNFNNAMVEDDEALAVLSGSGAIEFMGAVLTSTGLSIVTISILQQLADGGGEQTGLLFATGAVAMGAGYGLLVVTDRKRMRAVDVYNTNLGEHPPNRLKFSLRLSTTRNGVGLVGRF